MCWRLSLCLIPLSCSSSPVGQLGRVTPLLSGLINSVFSEIHGLDFTALIDNIMTSVASLKVSVEARANLVLSDLKKRAEDLDARHPGSTFAQELASYGDRS